jgi:uncharacterized protein YjbI with pentapeptide repeats
MASHEHLNILKRGVPAWNQWRKEYRDIQPDLTAADLRQAMLHGADFLGANLHDVDFEGATLRGASLTLAEAIGANFTDADLREAWLAGTDATGANFFRADLNGARLQEANFNGAILGYTTLVNTDLSGVKGLEAVLHNGPSRIGIDTIYLSRGVIPESFLREAGVPEPFVANVKSMVAAMEPIQFYSCFISYSTKDEEFSRQLHADLRSERVRCWFAPEDLKIGDRLRASFDDAIRDHDKLMVLLSEASVTSPWVEKEVETAFEKERKEHRTVLFPIRIDDAVMNTDQSWAADIRRTRHIGDFRHWTNPDSYKQALNRLLRDLRADTKTAKPPA